jgi:hypothetical protein
MKEGQEGYRTTTLTQSDHEIIRAFLASVPAGFPPSPGAALAELTGFSPLSPGLSGYYFFMLLPLIRISVLSKYIFLTFNTDWGDFCQDPTPDPSLSRDRCRYTVQLCIKS